MTPGGSRPGGRPGAACDLSATEDEPISAARRGPRGRDSTFRMRRHPVVSDEPESPRRSHDSRSIDRPSPATSAGPTPSDGGVDRRSLLAGAGSAVVAGLGAPDAGAAQPRRRDARPALRRIDAHTHSPRSKCSTRSRRRTASRSCSAARTRSMRALTDPQARLAILDRNEGRHPRPRAGALARGVPAHRARPHAAPQFARMMNDEIAAVVARTPSASAPSRCSPRSIPTRWWPSSPAP